MIKTHIIIGDLIFDRFIYGDATRISAEAPTLVLDVSKTIDMLGGAYNVCAHLCSLDEYVNFISVVGDDFNSIYNNFNNKFSLNCNTCLFEDNRSTSVKTRLISNYKNAHLIRYDKETTIPISKALENQILDMVICKITSASSINLIDYKKGVITKSLAKKVIEIGNKFNVPVLVDTKQDDIRMFAGCTILKPNKLEFEKIKLRYAPDLTFSDACKIICEKLQIKYIVITAGNEGIYAYDQDNGLTHIKGKDVPVKELSGAGDSVLATLAYCLTNNINFSDSIEKANNLASKFVSTGIEYRAVLEDLQ